MAATSRRVPLFWWCLAAGMTLWSLAGGFVVFLPPGLLPSGLLETVTCGWTSYGPMEDPQHEKLVDLLSAIQSWLVTGTPVLLALLAWTVAVRGRGRPRVHQWAAGVGTLAVALGYVITAIGAWLDPLPEEAACSVDPDLLSILSPADVAWSLGPALFVMAAAWTGLRDPLRRSPLPWRRIGLVTAAVVVAAATLVAVQVEWTAPSPAAVAADGTPRHALMISGRRLIVLDLERGVEVGRVPAADPELYNYTAVARDVGRGHYVAAASTLRRDGLGPARSRVYRISVDGGGVARVDGPVGGDLDGLVRDLAVSPEGRIAYARQNVDPGDGQYADPGDGPWAAVIGVLGPAREWPLRGTGTDGVRGLVWDGPATLVFQGVTASEWMELLALDTAAPGGGPRRHLRVRAMGVSAMVAGSATGWVVASIGDVDGRQDPRLALVDGAGGVVGLVDQSACGATGAALATDSTGRHLLVFHSGTGDETAGRKCADAWRELVRIDLPADALSAYAEEPPVFTLPGRVVWRGDPSVSALAW
ncbi:hypothetical protein [Microbispora sp. NPDC049125]|uniref:hypothetical protein n=1 Tax=Microbispora sp. NPDC049125 TaxID=3154929 RepID=UPI0034663C0C